MNRSVTVRLVVGIVAVCLVGTAVLFLAIRTLFGTTLNEPTSIEVQLDAPAQVTLNEPFAVTIQVTNLVTTSQTLHSIDLDSSYLENVNLSSTIPAYESVQSLPLTDFDSYLFEATIPAEATVPIELRFVGQKAGQFSGLIDVCLADGTLCLAQPLETTVVE